MIVLPKDKQMLDVDWDFWIFRRHMLDETGDLVAFLQPRRHLVPHVNRLQESALAGHCYKDCGSCTKPINSDDAYGGLAVIESEAKYVVMMPICRGCARTDYDLLETRIVGTLNKHLFGGKLEWLP